MKWLPLVVSILSLVVAILALRQSRRAANAAERLNKIEAARSTREEHEFAIAESARTAAELHLVCTDGRLTIANRGPAVARGVVCSAEGVVLSGLPEGPFDLQPQQRVVAAVHGPGDFIACTISWECDAGPISRSLRVQRN